MFLSSYFWYKTSYLACAVFLVKTAVFPWFLSKTHTVTNISHIACVNMNSNCVIGGPHISGLHIRTKSDQSHPWSYYPRGACCAAFYWIERSEFKTLLSRAFMFLAEYDIEHVALFWVWVDKMQRGCLRIASVGWKWGNTRPSPTTRKSLKAWL